MAPLTENLALLRQLADEVRSELHGSVLALRLTEMLQELDEVVSSPS